MLIFDFLRPGTKSVKRSWRSEIAAWLALTVVAGLVVWPAITEGVGRLYQLLEVKPHIFVWIPEDIIEQEGDPDYSRAGNAGFIITSDGVVAVDATNSPYHAREVLYEIRQKTSQPVRYLVNTGGSGDEVLGNEVFADLQVPILSTPPIQTEIRDRAQSVGKKLMQSETFGRRFRGIHITPPTQTFDGREELRLGGQSIRLTAFDPSLSAVAVHLTAAKVVFLGDLFQNRYFPRLESRDLGRWIDALRQAESWNADVYVPGHGQPGSKKDVAEFRSFLEWLKKNVQTKVQGGESLEQVKTEVSLSQYPWGAHELVPELVASVYEQFSPKASTGAANTHP